ncbi:sodium:proton antiporter [Alkalibacter rhizosphaerae]|uniref:Sodium:proton antiporter n=1 Tax=Alkalibacter rhizosphaerae TaxID=2815577 RepID=A0A975AIX5_9FIRM|nr:MnhB domain-containing protein [Alkalibacter rhizosphaerae]QSX08995.1 sodium:proton antiporter [Alkalibacter rhizosphaerae]
MKSNSQIIARVTGLLYPFIILIGFYIIINGHVSPGGGFQGGAVLASAFISRYLVIPEESIRIKYMQTLEKVLFFCIILIPTLFLFSSTGNDSAMANTIYLVVMNLLIGLKVSSGLTIIFYRFVFYEGGE